MTCLKEDSPTATGGISICCPFTYKVPKTKKNRSDVELDDRTKCLTFLKNFKKYDNFLDYYELSTNIKLDSDNTLLVTEAHEQSILNELQTGEYKLCCIKFKDFNIEFTNPSFPMEDYHLILIYSPDFDVLHLLLSIYFKNLYIDQLICMFHLLSNELDNIANKGDFYNIQRKNISNNKNIKFTFSGSKHLSDLFSSEFECVNHSERASVWEINNLNNDDNMKFKNYRNESYALLTTDEGWRSVPNSVVDKSLEKFWGTRKHFRVFSCGNIFLLFNLKNSLKGQYAKERALSFDTGCPTSTASHFMKQKTIPGLAHGPLHNLIYLLFVKEHASDQIAEAKLSINKTDKKLRLQVKKIKSMIEIRKKMISIKQDLKKVGIMEVQNHRALVANSLGIDTLIDSLKEFSSTVQEDLILLYQDSINKRVNITNVIILIVAFLTLVVTYIGSVSCK